MKRPAITLRAFFAVTAILLALSDAPPADAVRRVTAAELGDRWPLTVREGEVDCIGKAAVFRSGQKAYALNGAAKSRGYLPIEPIWKTDPTVPGLRINIGPLIDLALKQCP